MVTASPGQAEPDPIATITAPYLMTFPNNRFAARGGRRRLLLVLKLTFATLVVIGLPLVFTYRVVQQYRLNAQLIAAVKHNDAQAVRAWLVQGADANAHDGARQRSLWALLQDRFYGKPSSAGAGPSALAVALEWQDSNDDYPPENPDLIGALLDYGANPNGEAKNGSTPPDLSTNSTGQGAENLTLLQLALVTGRRNTVTLLLNHGADVNACNASKQTALMYASGADDPETTETLLRTGARVDAQDINGQTALMWAAISNSSHCVRVLLDHHADPTIRDRQGRTALDWAKKMGTQDAIRMLTKHL